MRSFFARLHRRYGKKITGAERQRFVRDKVGQEARLPAKPEIVRAAQRGKPQAPRGHRGRRFFGPDGRLRARRSLRCDRVRGARPHWRPGLEQTAAGRTGRGGRRTDRLQPSAMAETGEAFRVLVSRSRRQTPISTRSISTCRSISTGRRSARRSRRKIYDEMAVAFSAMTRLSRKDRRAPALALRTTRKNSTRCRWRTGSHTLDCSSLTRRALEEQFSNDAGQPAGKQNYLANLAVVRGGALDGQPDAFFSQTEGLRCSEGNHALASCLADAISASRRDHPLVHAGPLHRHRRRRRRAGSRRRARRSGRHDAVQRRLCHPCDPAEPVAGDRANEKISIHPQLPSDCYVSDGEGGEVHQPGQAALLDRRRPRPDRDIKPVWRHLGRHRQSDRPARRERPAQSLCRWRRSRRPRSTRLQRAASKRWMRSTQQRSARSTRTMRTIWRGTPDFFDWPNDPWTARRLFLSGSRAKSAGRDRCSTRRSESDCSSPASTPALPISATWKAHCSPAKGPRARSSGPSAVNAKAA